MLKKRSDGRYQKTVTIIEKGVKKRKYFYGTSQREINKKMVNYKDQSQYGRVFEAVADEWEEEHFKRIALSTAKGYTASLNRAIKYFGNTPIGQVTSQHINNFIWDFAQTGKSYKTVANQKLVLHLIFRHAIIRGDIKNNPVSEITVPKNLPKSERELPTEKEINIVINSVDKPFGLFYYMILFTGLRRGEALALKYQDIDKEKGVIHVSKSLYHDSNKAVIKSPKTKKAQRDIDLLDCLKKVLPDQNSGIVFANHNNQWLSFSQYRSFLKRYQKETGLRITPHQLRHAYATMLYEAGIADKDAQELLGHAQISTTKDIYTHISKRQKEKTAQRLNDYVNNLDL